MPYTNKLDELARGRIYRQSHKEEIKTKQAVRHLQLKVDALKHYGNGKCACVKCGNDGITHLSIDHLNSNGAEHRKERGVGSHFYLWLKNANYPEGYQTLCMNCQFDKRDYKKEVWIQAPKQNSNNPRLL
jgi:hypothetical protein